MKKTCAFALTTILTLPAFGTTDGVNLYEPYKKTMYGTPENTIAKTGNAQAKTPKSTSVDKKLVATDENVQPLQEETLDSVGDAQNDTLPGAEKISAENFESYSSSTSSSSSDIKFPHGLQLGLGVSVTGGLDGFVGYNNKKFDSFWWKRFGVRLGYATYSPIRSKMNSRINSSIGNDGIKIDDNLKINNINMDANHFGLLVDFYPFGDTWFLGGLRLSTGYMTGKLDLTADIYGTKNGTNIEFELGGTKYSYVGEMKGTAKTSFKYSGPYLGTGFDLGMFYGFKLYVDAGVVFTDKSPNIDLVVPLAGLQDQFGMSVQGNPTLEAAYETAKAKALSDAQRELDKIDYYPIVKMGFMYRF